MGLTTHPHLVPRLKKSRAISLLHFWGFVACYRVNFTFIFTFYIVKYGFHLPIFMKIYIYMTFKTTIPDFLKI